MFVKRYIAKDMQEAMGKIRRELGNDAVILNSRYVRRKGFFNLFRKKQLEVMVAHDPNEKKNLSAVAAEKEKEAVQEKFEQLVVQQAPNMDKIDDLNIKLEELEGVFRNFTEKIRIVDRNSALQFSPDVSMKYEKLMDEDVEPRLAKGLAEEAQDIMSRMEVEPDLVFEQLIRDRIGDPSPIRLKKFKRNIIMILGPTGVGKTTTLVKLAALYACEDDLKVGIINTDTYRVAAQEQLNIYSDIMDIPCDVAYTADELKEALRAQEDRDVVFIDTAGKSSQDKTYQEDLKKLLAVCKPDEVYLTVSVTTGYKACRDIIDNYGFIDDYKLIVTKLDEVTAWGNILNIADYAKRPMGYITMGQNVPDDIELADTDNIAGRIVRRGKSE